MIKYIVGWCLIYTYYGGPKASYDEFGRLSNSFTNTVAHQYVDTVCNSSLTPTYKMFSTLDSALVFMDKAKKQPDVCNVKIKDF